MAESLREQAFRIALPKVCRLRPEMDIKGAQQTQLLVDELFPLIIERVEGIENPYKHIVVEKGIGKPCLLSCQACRWAEAIQAVKDVLK